MDLVLKQLTEEHFQQSMDLSSFAFQYPLSPEQLEERRSSFTKHMKLGVFKNDQLCAQATLIDFETYIAGKAFPMGGIAGVSTWPEHRRNGYVAKILKELLLIMKQKGQSISMLHPFSFAFYRKFGWESYIDHKKYELQAEQLTSLLREYQQRHHEMKGEIVRLDDWKLLEQTYDQYAQAYNGMLKRTESWWQDVITVKKTGIYAAYRDRLGQIQGYIIYEVKNRQMTIHELIALTYEAEEQLLYYIAQHDSMVEKVYWTVPEDDTFVFGLSNPRIKQEIMPYFMARIVDVTAFIEQFPFEQAAEPEDYYIQLSDEQAEWNHGLFKLHIAADGKATIQRAEEEVNHGVTDNLIIASIGALTSWLLYYQTWNTMVRFHKLEGSEFIMKRFQKRIPSRTTYLADFF